MYCIQFFTSDTPEEVDANLAIIAKDKNGQPRELTEISDELQSILESAFSSAQSPSEKE
jgi:hypothetical protein